MSEDIKITRSSGNVFADLGLPDADHLLAKADLAIEISSIIEDRGLTQAEAAEIMGVDQPKVSALVRGRLDGFSMERLYRFLIALGSIANFYLLAKCVFCKLQFTNLLVPLGRDVEIVVRPTPESKKGSRLRVTRKPTPSRPSRSSSASAQKQAS